MKIDARLHALEFATEESEPGICGCGVCKWIVDTWGSPAYLKWIIMEIDRDAMTMLVRDRVFGAPYLVAAP